MSATSLVGSVIALDAHAARLHRDGLILLLREVERVQPAQLNSVRHALANVEESLRLCDAVASGAATGATGYVLRGGGWSHTSGRDEGVTEMLTASEAARRFGVSAAYVRRKAADWGGELIEGQWRIPSHRIRTLRTRRPT